MKILRADIFPGSELQDLSFSYSFSTMAKRAQLQHHLASLVMWYP